MPPHTLNNKDKSPCTVTLVCSCILTAAYIAAGVIFLALPTRAIRLLYPCLANIEDQATVAPSPQLTSLLDDVVRMAGACFLAISVSSLGILAQLLLCNQQGSGIDKESRDTFFSRTLFCIQAPMGLSLVGVALANISKLDSVSTDEHDDCNMLSDQIILWMGVGIMCIASIGLMSTFWPESEIEVAESEQIPHPSYRQCRIWCCCKRIGSIDSRFYKINMEPLPTDEDVELHTIRDGTNNDNEDAAISDIKDNQPLETLSSSRLQGTSRLLKLAGSESQYLWAGVAVLLVRLPFSLAIPHFVSTTIANLINEDFDGAKREVLLLFLLGTVDSILDFWCVFLFGKAKENIVRKLRVDTYSSMLRQEQAFFDATNTGELISRLTSDCGEMAGDLTWFFRFSVEAVVRILGISLYMVIRSPILGSCTLAIVPVVGVLNKVYGDWLGKNAKRVQNALAEATTSAHEALSCIKTVITLASEHHEWESYNSRIEKLYNLNIQQLIATSVYYMAVSTFLINTCVQAALLLLGSIFVEEGKLSADVLLAFMLYQQQLQEYTMLLFQSYSSLIKSSGAGDRVFLIMDRHPPPPGTGNSWVQSFETDTNEGDTKDDITIENVSFSYPSRPETLALDNISLRIKSGTVVALVGHSGCGKSTIVSLLERLYDPNEGTIKFGELDLRHMSLRNHRANIGLVNQDPVLFSGTLEDNIKHGSSATLQEVIVASKMANAHNFIESFPNKYKEQVGERGQALSGGQKQRIAIARALVRKPSLLLLDEATSALDPESEAAVQEALNELLRKRLGMTTIIIAHRLQTVRSVDTIFVMKNGAVIEEGAHDQLLQKTNGHYRQLLERVDSYGLLPVT